MILSISRSIIAYPQISDRSRTGKYSTLTKSLNGTYSFCPSRVSYIETCYSEIGLTRSQIIYGVSQQKQLLLPYYEQYSQQQRSFGINRENIISLRKRFDTLSPYLYASEPDYSPWPKYLTMSQVCFIVCHTVESLNSVYFRFSFTQLSLYWFDGRKARFLGDAMFIKTKTYQVV